MSVKSYKYNDNKQLSQHFNVREFKCKCGETHDILIDDGLITLLENLRSKLNSTACNIYSGYRCPKHDKNVGGSGKGPHTQGYAVDCYFLDKDRKRIPSKKVCLTLEDMGHKRGIGYRCGGSDNSTGNTHIDNKNRKWYGDESKSLSKSCCDSFYDYFGESKGITKTLTTNVYGRTGVGFSYAKTLYYKDTVVKDVRMNVGNSNGYSWFKGTVNGKTVYFPYNEKWYK